MKSTTLVLRGLTYYWRTNAAVVLGVAAAVAVLSGALLVGDSVRGSLRDLVVQRLGGTDQIVVSSGFFRDGLAEDLRANPEFKSIFRGVCPIVATQGFVSHQAGGGRAGKVNVYGVDDRFWQFHGVGTVQGPNGREALISTALAREIGAEPGAAILVRVQRPSEVPLESLHGRKEDLGTAIRATVLTVLPREALGEFSLQARQDDVLAVFLPLSVLQRELEIGSRVNALLVSGASDGATAALQRMLRSEYELEDLGLKFRQLDSRNSFSLETDSGLLDDARANASLQTANEIEVRPQPVFTYLVNSLRSGDREIPYSLVTAMDITELAPAPGQAMSALPPMLLTDWAARDLRVSAGDTLTMEYYVWEDPGQLVTRLMEFEIAGIVPIDTRDRDLAPAYRGISDSARLVDWDPPFPIDLRRIRPIDEEFWLMHRTTPKAFIHFAVGQQLWRSRYGSVTSMRFIPDSAKPVAQIQDEYARRLRARLDPLAAGFSVKDVRSESLAASRGATNFGEYFVYFSFFIVVSALLLAALFFKLSVEQRARELGLLRAVGFGTAAVRRLFAGEGLMLSIAGSSIGILGGLLYGYLMVAALRTWWVDAVGTTAITLHLSPMSMIAGALGGIAAAMVCIWITLRSLEGVSERALLAGQIAPPIESGRNPARGTRSLPAAIALAGLGIVLIVAAAAGLLERAGAFFGAGSTLLGACLCFFVYWFGRPARKAINGSGWWPVFLVGLRNATYRPVRGVLPIAMIASATFILISVDAFRKDGAGTRPDPGTGGYSLLVETMLPLVNDPGSREGLETLGLAGMQGISIEPFRVRQGDDASCLNLYEPRNPRILAPGETFLHSGRFVFQDSLASTDAERANPWLLLRRSEPDGAIPVVADANSMTYVLHRNLGDDIVITAGQREVRLRFVAALHDSIFQGELLMSQTNFLDLFPHHEGYQLFLVETPVDQTKAAASAIENALTDFGADVTTTADRLAGFHRVENTYLSTFQMLGGLGLLLGTVGLGAVLLRNVFERRRELALLRALGYKRPHFFAMVTAENVMLLVCGLLTGVTCALLAIAPVMLERGGRLPGFFLAILLGSVLAAGLITSLVATAVALRSSLLEALRSE